MNLGNRIVVVGVSAAGKFTFSRSLADKLQLPLIPTDSIMWKPGWDYIGDRETEEKLEEISSAGEWIIEGYISKGVRTLLFDRADSIIYLDYPSFVAPWRYIKRWWKHRKSPRPEIEGCPERFSFRFLNIILTKSEAKSLNKFLKVITNCDKLITITMPRKAERFLREI